MRTPILGGALVLACAVGCSGFDSSRTADPALGESTSAIQGGTDDTTHNFAVGIVLAQDTGAIALCSGVLLAPNLVATARHCVSSLASSEIDCATSTFTETFPAQDLFVTQQPTLPMQANAAGYVRVASNGIFVPTGNGVCGNDLALLVLEQSLTVPQYVTPTINPPMTDHHVYTTAYTAIGYGIDAPTDTQGAGVRRIRENINLGCIPNDPNFVDCFSFAGASQFIDPKEFEGGDGTCEGDSGSGAYDQGSFNAGNWVAFGVLSRGSVSAEGGSCLGAIYTRFDAWSSLLTQAATQAAQMGNYPLPAWAGSSGATSCQSNGVACSADTDCCSVNCETLDNGATFSCVACDDADHPCSSGYGCRADGVCVLGLRSTVAGTAGATSDAGVGSGSHSGGCAVVATGVEGHVGWGAWPAGLGLTLGALLRRRRGRADARTGRGESHF